MTVQIGEYEHYKGNRYEVLFIARHSENLEKLVVYRGLYGSNDVWVRPYEMFIEKVMVDGKPVPRFRFIK